MKELSLFLLKNSLALKMKRGIRNFCNGVGSTSTLNQRKADGGNVSCIAAPSLSGSYLEERNLVSSPRTLEEMILQLDMEEAAARRPKLDEFGEPYRRMSCVNNSDILRSARNALNQYPRFSLDGRDAMYRSSFRNLGAMAGNGSEGSRKSSAGCSAGFHGRCCGDGYRMDVERCLRLPAKVAGESVVWCKPGVVAKLMGLDAVPVPVCTRHGKRRPNPVVNSRKQNLRRMGRGELERDRAAMGLNGMRGRARREGLGSSLMDPVTIPAAKGTDEWHFGRVR